MVPWISHYHHPYTNHHDNGPGLVDEYKGYGLVEACETVRLMDLVPLPFQGTIEDLGWLRGRGMGYLDYGAGTAAGFAGGVGDLISSKFDAVISSIDDEIFGGEEMDLGMFCCFLHPPFFFGDVFLPR